MVTPWDRFIGTIERRKKQLDEVLESYRAFRERLEALPPEIMKEAEKMLVAEARPRKTQELDMRGKTSLECAKIILRQNDNEPMHFSTIAKEALSRGYAGRAKGDPDEVENRTINSFWAALHRSEEFERTGKGCYRLNESS